MWLSRYVIWFMGYSLLGWIWESLYCTLRERRWEKRGFLYGPICPIYGFAAVALIGGCQALEAAGRSLTPWEAFAVTLVGSAVIEYLTSYVLEKLFHGRWWDYSDMPLNLNGRICLPASLLFGLMGMLVSTVLYEPTVHSLDALPLEPCTAIAMAAVALTAADTALTASALTEFGRIAAQTSEMLNARMVQVVDNLNEGAELMGETVSGHVGQVVGSLSEGAERLRSQAVAAMSETTREAVARIQGFSEVGAEHLESLWRMVRRS